MSEAFREAIRGTSASGGLVHRALGIAVLALVLLRIVLRLRHGAPPPTPQSPAWDRTLSHLAYLALYALILATPALGVAAWSTASDALGEAHEAAKTALMMLIILHIVGALYHQVVLKDHLLRRMIAPRS